MFNFRHVRLKKLGEMFQFSSLNGEYLPFRGGDNDTVTTHCGRGPFHFLGETEAADFIVAVVNTLEY